MSQDVRHLTIAQLLPDQAVQDRVWQACMDELEARAKPGADAGEPGRIHKKLLAILDEDRERLLAMEVLPEYLAYALEAKFMAIVAHEIANIKAGR